MYNCDKKLEKMLHYQVYNSYSVFIQSNRLSGITTKSENIPPQAGLCFSGYNFHYNCILFDLRRSIKYLLKGSFRYTQIINLQVL